MTMSPALSTGVSVCSNESTAAAGTIIHTTRGAGSFATRSVTEVAAVAPSAASALIAGALKSNATHSCPARIRRRAMFEPMRPRPIIPIFKVCLALFDVRSPWPARLAPSANRIRAQKSPARNRLQVKVVAGLSGCGARGALGDGDAVASGRLRLIEGSIGARNHGLELLVVPASGQAERHRHLTDALFSVGAANLAALDRSADAFRQLDPAGARGMRQQHGEFLAADAGNGTAIADAAAQYVGHRDDDLVAQQVAVGVVDGLEMVDIDDQQRAALHAALADALHLLIKTAAVEQSGQRVGQRQPLHQLQLAAQPLDLLGTLLQVLVIDAGLDAHPVGLADQRLDHLMQGVLADFVAQPVAVAFQLIAVMAYFLAGVDRDIVDMINHARDLGAHTRRGVDISHRDV